MELANNGEDERFLDALRSGTDSELMDFVGLNTPSGVRNWIWDAIFDNLNIQTQEIVIDIMIQNHDQAMTEFLNDTEYRTFAHLMHNEM